MKKKSMLKRMAAVFMGTVMLLGTAGAVSAATAPDLSGQGSLQIFKQDENKEPIADVTFNYVEIGEFYQSEGTPVLGYTITNDELLGYLKTEGLAPVYTDNGTEVYDGAAMQSALAEAVKTKKKRDYRISCQYIRCYRNRRKNTRKVCGQGGLSCGRNKGACRSQRIL